MITCRHKSHSLDQAQDMEFDRENPLITTTFEEHNTETVPDLFDSESDHMPSKDSLRNRNIDSYNSFRTEATSLILQAQFSCNFEPFISYLAVNYLDRYVSKREIPQGKPWISRLLVMACLSLAAKMKNMPLSLSHIQREEGLAFEPQTVRKMESLVLDALSWRMRSVTPFSFFSFFLSTFELSHAQSGLLRDRASDIVFASQTDVKILEFKPSIIAASAILSASRHLFPTRFACFEAYFSACQYVDNESLWKCYSVMQEMVLNVESVEMSPKFTDSEMSESFTETTTKSSTVQRCFETEENKRRRLSGVCSGSSGGNNTNNGGLEISQFSPY